MGKCDKVRVVILGPSLTAVSGFSTHINILLRSRLAREFELIHFQVGSEGRQETRWQANWRFLSSPISLAVFLSKWRPRIVHINTCLARKAFWRDVVYLQVARVMGCKVIYQTHGGALPQTFFSGNRLLTWLLRKTLLASHVVTVLSKEELGAYQRFDPRVNVNLVPNAIEVIDDGDLPRHYNTGQPLKLVYLGRLIASKGIFEMVDAVVHLRNRGIRCNLRVAGTGPDEGELKAAVSNASLDDVVEFVGAVFGSAKQQLLRESDVFVFPTYHSEGLPYAILEAMAAGCIPITCGIAAIPDVIDDGVDGFLVPPKDVNALKEVLIRLDEDRSTIARMANAAKQKIANNYTSDRLAADFRRLYLTV